jgi:hypothetical protein
VIRLRHHTLDRPYVDQCPRTLLAELLQRHVAAVHHAFQVDVHHTGVILRGNRVEHANGTGGRVVDPHVDTAKVRHGRIEEALHVFLLADIHRDY